MINESLFDLGNEPNAIRALFAYGLERKSQIGADKVYDFSIGNPSIPAPIEVKQAILDLMDEDPQLIHGYTPGAGSAEAREEIARSINQRFGMCARASNIYLTVGAAASLRITFAALTAGDEEMIVVAPYFPEYKIWIEQSGSACVEVLADADTFQLDLAAIEAAITAKTKAIVINSPNNPTGAVYSRESLEQLATLLKKKEEEYGSSIFIVCDEPYREIAFDGIEVPYIPALYEKTIVCYSYSKSLSLPGERIGYVYVSERIPQADRVYTAVCGAGRALGFVCAPSLFQHVIKRCVDVPSDVAAYAENRALLTEGLSRLGYEFVEPQGAFYLWMKALEPHSEAFAERAKAHELLLVPSTSFGCDGWVRIGYCVSAETIKNSMTAFSALMDEYRAEKEQS